MSKLEQAARQAFDVDEALVTLELILKDGVEYGNWPLNKNCEDGLKAITALREAFAGVNMSPTEQAEQEKPLYRKVLREMLDAHEQAKQAEIPEWVDVDDYQEQAEQEPVAWAYIDSDGSFMDALDKQHGAYQTPLYTAPVQQVDMNLNCKSVQKRLATSWGYVKAEQAEQEPVGYIDAGDLRELCNGNERQYSLFTKDKGRMVAIYAAPVRTKDLTDDEIRAVLDKHCGDGLMSIAYAVIAADREKNK